MLESIILYVSLISICMALCYYSKNRHTKGGVILAYGIIALVSIIRYDVGWDYSGYTEMIERFSNLLHYRYQFIDFYGEDIKVIEPVFLGFCWTFRNVANPSVWVIGGYAFLSILFVYKAIDDNGGKVNYSYHALGIFALFIFYVLFFFWDGIRQGLSIAIFIYALKYIQAQRIGKYFFWVFIAATVHLSALIALPVYFVGKIKYRRWLSVGIVMVLMILYIARILDSVVNKIYNIIPYYNEIYADDELYASAIFGFGPGVLLRFILWLVLLINVPKNNRVYANLLFLGICLYVISCNNLNITRIGNIFFFSIILSFPHVLSNLKKGIYRFSVVVLCLMTFYVNLIVDNKNGAYPYKTIFSEDFKRGVLREKELQ